MIHKCIAKVSSNNLVNRVVLDANQFPFFVSELVVSCIRLIHLASICKVQANVYDIGRTLRDFKH